MRLLREKAAVVSHKWKCNYSISQKLNGTFVRYVVTTPHVNYAMTVNYSTAHYDLGAGGRGVTTDCHDAANPDASGFDPNGGAPHCFAGGRLQGISAGIKYIF